MGKIKSFHAGTQGRKKEILMAALACFTRSGYDGTSIADICAASGASVGSIYHHFNGKEGVGAALYLEGIRQYQAGLLNSLEAETKTREGIAAVARYHVLWVRDNDDWARFLFQKRHEQFMAGTEETMGALNREFAERISRWFAPRVTKGEIRKMAWDLYIAIMLGPCQEFSRLYLAGKAVSDPETAAREIADAAWRSLAVK